MTTTTIAVPRDVPDGYMPIPTAEQLADALENVRCFHDMSAELIAPELLVNLLGAPTVKAEQVLVTHDLRAKLISGLDEIGALSRNLRQGGCDSSDLPGLEEGLAHAIGMAHELISLLEAPYLPAAGLADLTAVRCQCCATEYPHDSYDAGFIAGSGMCQVCDAAMPPKDLPAAGSAEEEVEVVAWRYRHSEQEKWQAGVERKSLWETEPLMTVAQHERIVAALSAHQSARQPELTVWEGPMPESNGKSNFTAVLMRKGANLFDGIAGGMTIARSEYPDRVRYEADCVRWLIGELDNEPCIIDYDADKHSGYVAQQSAHVSVLRETLENARRAMFAVLNQEPRMKAVAKRVLNAEIDLIDRALLNGGEA